AKRMIGHHDAASRGIFLKVRSGRQVKDVAGKLHRSEPGIISTQRKVNHIRSARQSGETHFSRFYETRQRIKQIIAIENAGWGGVEKEDVYPINSELRQALFYALVKNRDAEKTGLKLGAGSLFEESMEAGRDF